LAARLDFGGYDAAMAYSRAAIVLPGRTFGPHAPLLWYCAWAALNRGANVHYVQWNGSC
jgi:hypothetical protein